MSVSQSFCLTIALNVDGRSPQRMSALNLAEALTSLWLVCSEALLRLYLRYGLSFHACCAEPGWQRFLTPPGASAFAHQNLARQIAHHYWSAQQVPPLGCDQTCLGFTRRDRVKKDAFAHIDSAHALYST